jgi:hypothetical protein
VFVHTGWSAKDDAPGDANITALLAFRNGDLWIAVSDKGVSGLRDGRNTHYTDSDGLPSRAVRSLAQDTEGAIWAGTEGGLARSEHDRRQPVGADWGYRLAGQRPFTLTAMQLFGLLWKKTYSPPGSRKFQTTKAKIGQTQQIVESPSGILWMAETTRSVHRVIDESARFRDKIGHSLTAHC